MIWRKYNTQNKSNDHKMYFSSCETVLSCSLVESWNRQDDQKCTIPLGILMIWSVSQFYKVGRPQNGLFQLENNTSLQSCCNRELSRRSKVLYSLRYTNDLDDDLSCVKSRASAKCAFPMEIIFPCILVATWNHQYAPKCCIPLGILLIWRKCNSPKKLSDRKMNFSNGKTILSCNLVESWNRQDAQKCYISLGIFIIWRVNHFSKKSGDRQIDFSGWKQCFLAIWSQPGIVHTLQSVVFP